MEIKVRHHAKGEEHILQFDATNTIILTLRKNESASLAIGFKLNDGQWYYQSLMWGCRAGKAFWFRPMVSLYRYIRKHKLTDNSLRFIAWADHRLKNGGYMVNSESHKSWIAIGKRLKAANRRELDIAALVIEGVEKLNFGPHWFVDQLSPTSFVLNERTPMAGMPTGCVMIKTIMGSVFVQRITGISRCANDSDPFRKMLRRSEGPVLRFNNIDLTPEEVVSEAMEVVVKLMDERQAGFEAGTRLAA